MATRSENPRIGGVTQAEIRIRRLAKTNPTGDFPELPALRPTKERMDRPPRNELHALIDPQIELGRVAHDREIVTGRYRSVKA
jgi:hypothetical protein